MCLKRIKSPAAARDGRHADHDGRAARRSLFPRPRQARATATPVAASCSALAPLGDFAFKVTNPLRARHLSVDFCRRVARKVGTTPGGQTDGRGSVVQAAARRVTVRARVSSLCDKMLAWRLRRVRCSYLWRLFVTVTRLRRDVTVFLRNCHSTESVPIFGKTREYLTYETHGNSWLKRCSWSVGSATASRHSTPHSTAHRQA